MPGRVCLAVVAGPIQGRQFAFEDHDTFLFGRSPDCHAQLAEADTTASRHHFLLEVNPPAVRLRDLGSLNGTYVNGTKYGGRGTLTLEKARQQRWPEVDLRDGDGIRVGTTVFEVHVEGGTEADSGARAQEASAVTPAPVAPPGAIAGFEVGPLLGRGGMGSVYKATRKADGVVVALKLMRPEVVVDTHSRETFAREIEVTASLRHPNVVALYEHGVEGDTFYFALEYCPGGSLAAALLKREGPLEVETAVRLALEALEGLGYAHQQGFVHRDIKPENLLLTDAAMKTAKLADFGLAKSFELAGLSGMTATGMVAGTLYFMPREQITHFRLLRPASDVWSMGATLYHMLTLRYPRDFLPEADPLHVILSGGTLPLRQRDPWLPAGLAEVVDRAVADDLKARYATAVEFRDALRRAL
jgi:eukaryotic-like serine/threonine-protein kinase